MLSNLIDRYLIFVIPIIAIAIFINQIYRQEAYGLSVWKGGGMGMFAALDRPSRSRFVNIYIEDSLGIKHPVLSSAASLGQLKYIVTTEPSEQNLENLMLRVKSLPWSYSDQTLPLYSFDQNMEYQLQGYVPELLPFGNKKVKIKSISIQFGHIFYDKKTKVLSSKVLKEKLHVN